MGAWTIAGNLLSITGVPGVLGTQDNNALIVETNGTERLRVDTSGNVGIGTANPAASLSLGNFNGVRQLIWDGGENDTQDINCGFGINLAGTGSSLDIFMSRLYGLNIVAPTGPWPYLSYTPLVTVLSGGSVGIGTVTPKSALEVQVTAPVGSNPINVSGWSGALTLTNTAGGSGGAAASGAATAIDLNTFANPASTTYTPSARIVAYDDGNFGAGIYFLTRSPGAASNGMVNRFQISSDGNVGIGITQDDAERGGEPSSPLVVHGNVEVIGNGNVGIGTSAPVATLDVGSGLLHVGGTTTPTTTAQGAYLGWNALTGGTGETDFINNQGQGTGGFAFMNTPPSGSPRSTLMVITGNGDVQVPGDILLTGADCAEQFDVSGHRLPEPGTVVVIDEGGALTESRDAYDKKVAGVVSGAGDYRHGIVLDQRPESEGRVAVALVGKVYCKVDAQYSPIEVGDLLATSATPGHAMKAGEPQKAFGAIIGKALKSLAAGVGLIPILVALQ
jgi:hypothetical protein